MKDPGQKDSDEGDDPTELRSNRDGVTDDESRLRRGDASSEADEADLPPGRSDEDDPTEMRQPPPPSPESEDDTEYEQTTRIRGRRIVEDDEAEDVTRLRAPPAAGDDDEITQFRAPGSNDAPDDMTRLRAPAPGAEFDDDDGDATRMRGRPGAKAARGDDDPTITARAPNRPSAGVRRARAGDEDTTIRKGDLHAGDDDPTMQTKLRGRRVVDEDAPIQSAEGADEDPTVQGTTGGNLGQSNDKSLSATTTLGGGTVLKGRFVLEGKLGEGGMGGVYKAVDLVKQEARDRNPHVAVKVLNENFAEHPDAFIALQRESSRTQRLSHPNIASVYDFDRDGQTAYMVMELMQGDPLDKFLKKHRQGVPKEQALSMIHDMASALAYAHGQNLIHSDFKPGNIFLTAGGTAKVFDFGIARAAAAPGEEKAARRGPISEDTLGQDDGTDKTLFDAGQLGALTPAYAACEMFEGKEPAPQDDVYALGIVAYQCLTGRHPYDRKKAPIAEAQKMVLQRPDGLTRREWNALRHSLAFRREDRTPNAQVFLDEFFGVAGTGARYAVLGAAGVAVVVAGLYFGGIIGPGAAPIEVPREWVELDTRIDNARSGVQEQLATPIFSPIWEEFVQRDIRRWEEAATPLVVAATFSSAEQMEATRRRVFDELAIPLRVQAPEEPGGHYRLLAGPFSGAEADSRRADVLARLRAAGLEAVEESDTALIAQARDQALGVYLAEIERLMPGGEPPAIPTIRDGERFVASPERLEDARNQVARMRDAQEVLNRASERYPTRPERLAALRTEVNDTRTLWQEHIDQAIARASSRQAEEDRAELIAQQREQAEADRRRAYESMRDDRVFPTFAGRCHHPNEVQAVLADFGRLQPEDQEQALQYAFDCANGRITRTAEPVMESRSLILAVAEHSGLASITPPDPCSSRAYIGNGRTSFCTDELASGGTGPAIVVVPGMGGNSNAIYGIGKYEVAVGEFNAFCQATDCGTPASGGPRMPATAIPIEAAKAYAAWLSEQTGYTYRLPTVAEWRHAADANGSPLDSNRNCYSSVRGVLRGETMINVTQGAPNAWGLINHVGNAQEWVTPNSGSGWVAIGGKHTDALSECTVQTRVEHNGRPDAVTGFRLLREIR